MCRPSVVTEDWVKKGCHIHVGAVELVVRPDHLGGVVFRPWFSKTPPEQAAVAIKIAREQCLADEDMRRRWIRDIEHAALYMLGYEGSLESLANGRLLEFKFLVLALERYGG
jgi:hypothetical protein